MIHLRWSPPFSLNISGIDPDITGYIVYKRRIGTGENANNQTEANFTTVTDKAEYITDLEDCNNCMLSCEFRVSAINGVGEGNATAPIVAACPKGIMPCIHIQKTMFIKHTVKYSPTCTACMLQFTKISSWDSVVFHVRPLVNILFFSVTSQTAINITTPQDDTNMPTDVPLGGVNIIPDSTTMVPETDAELDGSLENGSSVLSTVLYAGICLFEYSWWYMWP